MIHTREEEDYVNIALFEQYKCVPAWSMIK